MTTNHHDALMAHLARDAERWERLPAHARRHNLDDLGPGQTWCLDCGASYDYDEATGTWRQTQEPGPEGCERAGLRPRRTKRHEVFRERTDETTREDSS